ncbi:hypothetical protein REPUB_Repub09cG0163600 [Reevesia pubescens]
MVLRSEKNLLSANKEQEMEIAELKLILQDKNQEVKADKYSTTACHQWHGSSPKTPRYDRDELFDSLEFSYGDLTSLGSPDDLFLKDLNPYLTPYYAKTKSKEFDEIGYELPHNEPLSENNKQTFNELRFSSRSKKLSKSSYCYQDSNSGSSKVLTSRQSDESTCSYRKQMHHKPF